MSENGYDAETGELPIPTASVRAASSAAMARVQIDRDRKGYDAPGLHWAIHRAVEKMPVWIKAEKSGGKGKYAPLKDILAVVRPLLSDQGIRIRQGASKSWGADEGGGVKGRLVPVYTDLVDVRTGDYERTEIEIPLSQLSPQAMGSALTYGKRYTLLAALGLASDEADDDGEAAMPKDISERPRETPLFLTLRSEINEAKNVDALNKWSADPKNRKRIDQLSEGEADRLREAYGNVREKLSAAE